MFYLTMALATAVEIVSMPLKNNLQKDTLFQYFLESSLQQQEVTQEYACMIQAAT